MIVQDNNIAYHTLHVHVYVCGYRCKEHDIARMVSTLLIIFQFGSGHHDTLVYM